MTAADSPRNLTARVASGFAWVVSGTVATLLLKVGVLAVLARLLAPADFGLMAIGMSFSALATLLGESGMTATLVQRRELRPDHASTAFVFSIVVGAAMCLLTLLAAPAAESFFRMPGLAPILSVLGIGFAMQALSSAPRALLMRAMRFRTLAAINLLSYALSYGALSCLLAWFGFGVWALVAGVTAQTATATAAALLLARHSLALRFSRSAFKELFATSVWFSATGFANLVAVQADNLIIGRMLGAQALGFYSRSYQLMTIPAKALGQAASFVAFPSLSQVQGDRERLRRAFLLATRITALGGLSASALVPLYAPEIVSILFGPKWAPIVPLLSILGAGTYFRLGYKLPSTLLTASGLVRAAFRVQTVYAIAVVLGCVIAAPFGLAPISAAVVGATGIAFAHTNLLAARAVGASARDFASALLPGVLLAITLTLVAWLAAVIARPYGVPLLTAGLGAFACALSLGLCLAIPPLRRTALSLNSPKLQRAFGRRTPPSGADRYQELAAPLEMPSDRIL